MTTPRLPVVQVPHIVKGAVVEQGAQIEHLGADGLPQFSTPVLNLDHLVWRRTEPLPTADVPVAEIIDLLVATGEHLAADLGGFSSVALEGLSRTSPYEFRILENAYEDLSGRLSGDNLVAQVDLELGGRDVLDGWAHQTSRGRAGYVRAYPSRMIHVLAGNAPGVALQTIVRGALTKGVHLLKMPSNDLFTATAILRTMMSVAPGHPVCRSFSAVYWRGGDSEIEPVLMRAQFFDKLVAWGGDAAVRNAAKYLGPGLELISFDPKSSISFIGLEALESQQSIADVAALAAADSAFFNQEACTTSRFQFIEGPIEKIDRYCEALHLELMAERRFTSAKLTSLPIEVREEIEGLALLEPEYRVFGDCDGSGLVIRSYEPVDFFPSMKTVNVVAVNALEDAVKYVNVATQTIGVYPSARKTKLRDLVMAAGAQRIIELGHVSNGTTPGLPHDGFYPLQRFVRWVSDE